MQIECYMSSCYICDFHVNTPLRVQWGKVLKCKASAKYFAYSKFALVFPRLSRLLYAPFCAVTHCFQEDQWWEDEAKKT